MLVPDDRVRVANDAPVQSDRDVVLYWMIAARRTRHSFGLQRAVQQAQALGKPLVVLEPLRVGYRWASVRHHTFVVQGMVDNQAACAAAGVTYHPYVEPEAGAGKGLLAAWAARAAVVITDDYPTFFLPHMVAAAGAALDVRLEVVDSNGILPLSAAGRVFTTAASFRRHLHKTIAPHLDRFPVAEPLASYDQGPVALPEQVMAQWPAADLAGLLSGGMADLPIDQTVGAVADRPGGAVAAGEVVDSFFADRLARYADGRNDPDDEAGSMLSPWLHFGHLGAHELVARVFERVGWTPNDLAPKPTGSRAGWWGVPEPEEAFLDEIITWREIGHVFCDQRPDDHDSMSALPDWAVKTLTDHADDPRPSVYTLEELTHAKTHDPIWNAAQRQLLHQGRIHNYLRMLWGKKILEWTPSPEVALETLFELNNRYALDGRDPNSVSGILWTLGRFDRAWGPERPIFGKIRFMSSDSTRRKLKLKQYLARWGAPA